MVVVVLLAALIGLATLIIGLVGSSPGWVLGSVLTTAAALVGVVILLLVDGRRRSDAARFGGAAAPVLTPGDGAAVADIPEGAGPAGGDRSSAADMVAPSAAGPGPVDENAAAGSPGGSGDTGLEAPVVGGPLPVGAEPEAVEPGVAAEPEAVEAAVAPEPEAVEPAVGGGSETATDGGSDTGPGAVGGSPAVPIVGYNELRLAEILARLPALEPGMLEAVHRYESRNRGRRTILARIAELSGDPVAADPAGPAGGPVAGEMAEEEGGQTYAAETSDGPIPGYERLRVVEILAALPALGPSELRAVAEREGAGAGRSIILARIAQLSPPED